MSVLRSSLMLKALIAQNLSELLLATYAFAVLLGPKLPRHPQRSKIVSEGTPDVARITQPHLDAVLFGEIFLRGVEHCRRLLHADRTAATNAAYDLLKAKTVLFGARDANTWQVLIGA